MHQEREKEGSCQGYGKSRIKRKRTVLRKATNTTPEEGTEIWLKTRTLLEEKKEKRGGGGRKNHDRYIIKKSKSKLDSNKRVSIIKREDTEIKEKWEGITHHIRPDKGERVKR